MLVGGIRPGRGIRARLYAALRAAILEGRLPAGSRLPATRALAEAAARLGEPVPVWLQASTLSLHGDAGEAEVDEDTPAADGPPQLAGVARAWEEAAAGVHARRTVLLRSATVLEADTPALDSLVATTLRGRGGRAGSGTQWVSWVHVDDWLAVASWVLTAARRRRPSSRPSRSTRRAT